MIQSVPQKAVKTDMVQWTGTPASAQEIRDWVRQAARDMEWPGSEGFYPRNEVPGIEAHARLWDARLHTWSVVPLGHWVAKDAKYGFHVLSPEELESGYDLPKPGGLGRTPVVLAVDPGVQTPQASGNDYVNRLMGASSIPESWDGEESAEWIMEQYLLELERRVLALGGSLERWTDEEECPPNCKRPGTHGAHPAADVMPSMYGIRGHVVMTPERAEAARRAAEAMPLIDKAAALELIGPAYAHRDGPCDDTCYQPKEV